jgi:hypothetical protein
VGNERVDSAVHQAEGIVLIFLDLGLIFAEPVAEVVYVLDVRWRLRDG